MKVERIEPKKEFIPITITLETQEEVDALHGIFNHGKLADILEKAFNRGPYVFLTQYADTANSYKYHTEINTLLK